MEDLIWVFSILTTAILQFFTRGPVSKSFLTPRILLQLAFLFNKWAEKFAAHYTYDTTLI